MSKVLILQDWVWAGNNPLPRDFPVALTLPQSHCSYSILDLKLFDFFTKNITKRPSETAKLHQENGRQHGYRLKHRSIFKFGSNNSSYGGMVVNDHIKVCSINFEPPAEFPWLNAIPEQLWLFLVKIRSSWHDLMPSACPKLPKDNG